MNDSKDHKSAAEPPLDCRVGQRIKRYLRQLAPHQNEREGPTLLRDALAEIERLGVALEKANGHAEHFEREWYLCGDEIDRLREILGDIKNYAHKTDEVLRWCNDGLKVPNA